MASDLIISDQKSDMVLKVRHGGYSWRFPAHSLLLTAKSDKFREMIEEREDHSELPLSVTIVGTHPDTILTLIKYIYSGRFPTNVTADLLVAAEKYGLVSLRTHLEDHLLPKLTVAQACHLLEEFQPLRGPDDCSVKAVCKSIVEEHAFRVFSSDLVFVLGRRNLQWLLCSDDLNVPDESVVFWGVWRWGRRICCMNGRKLDDQTVAGYIEDLLRLIRVCSLKNRGGIPEAALRCFNRCLGVRSAFQMPEDALEQCFALRTGGFWEDMTGVLTTERGNLCLQVSFDREVILFGMTLEVCGATLKEAFIQIFRESDAKEVFRQEIKCFRCSTRKLSRSGEAESWLRARVVLSEPLGLPGSEIYSAYLRLKCEKDVLLPRVLVAHGGSGLEGGTFATVHGQAVVAVSELHVVKDAGTTWGYRGS